MGLSGLPLTILCCAFAAIGSYLFGYDSGVIGSVIAQTEFIDYFDSPSANQTGAMVSVFQAGAAIGALTIGYLLDHVGRKNTIVIGAILVTIGCAIQTGATSIGMLIGGRAIAGFAVGQLSGSVPVFCSEVAPAAWRGLLTGMQQFMLSWGFFFAQWISYGCSFSSSQFSWRFPLAFQCMPAILLIFGYFFLPESPRWLMQHGQEIKARETLVRLHGESNALTEFSEIEAAIALDNAHTVKSFGQIFSNKDWRWRLFLGCLLQAMGQFSGINVASYYQPSLYKALGFGTETQLMLTGISGALSIVYCFFAIISLDKVGRKIPLIIGMFGMAFALSCEAGIAANLDSLGVAGQRAGVAMIFLFSFFFTPLGVISWVYPAEIFPMQVRAVGNAASTFCNWTANVIFAQTTPLALATIKWKYYTVFIVLNVIDGLLVWLIYPETKGKSLEQMDEAFGGPAGLNMSKAAIESNIQHHERHIVAEEKGLSSISHAEHV